MQNKQYSQQLSVSIVGFSGIVVSQQFSAKPKIERLRTPTTVTGSETLPAILQQKRNLNAKNEQTNCFNNFPFLWI